MFVHSYWFPLKSLNVNEDVVTVVSLAYTDKRLRGREKSSQ